MDDKRGKSQIRNPAFAKTRGIGGKARVGDTSSINHHRPSHRIRRLPDRPGKSFVVARSCRTFLAHTTLAEF